ncbi:GTPase [Thermodesulforhabdus norvegica]|uniref:50S ribosome-binding GTPase n=1 Tax=Thermodesulforhabdus norvegica TaxID=39841 RepID=A0A1I4QUI4_9BACT|nr:GTPase [Thermodesulforhabdus norvegica]SFM43724.1 50S ribosome-binding GTPase [Thermodesulforhabdus norvegica]
MEEITESLKKLKDLEIPGFTVKPEKFKADLERFVHTLSLWDVKKNCRPAFWCVIVGGTGTGKSTIFNCLCGFPASITGVERPKTRGVILAAPSKRLDALFHKLKEWGVSNTFDNELPASGTPDRISIVGHENPFLSGWIFVDTPDLDSLEDRNRKLAEWMVALADMVIFVVSQEKYADLQLVEYLDRFLSESADLGLVVNKVHYPETIREDVASLIKDRSRIKSLGAGDILVLPYDPSVLSGNCSDMVCEPLRLWLTERCFGERKSSIMKESDEFLRKRLVSLCDEISSVLKRENREIDGLIEQVELYARESYESLIHSHGQEVIDSVKAALQAEIGRFYSRYDFLAGPRRIVRKILGVPLRLLGFPGGSERADKKQMVATLRENLDYSSVLAALDGYVRKWYELSSRYENMPVAGVLRDPELILSDGEVKNFLIRRSEELFFWLEGQFAELSKGIPKTKEWGIYSTVVIWALFMLSVEAALGGGISLFEAALDSVLAPFISKGAVEWFARKDVQRIGKELIEKYRQALEEVINMQKERFLSALMHIRVPDERVDEAVCLCERFLKKIS